MEWLSELGRRLIALFRRGRFDADLDEEMRLHRELREQERIAEGITAEEAHYAATKQFGNPLNLREESHDMWGWNWLENFVQDIHFGLRQLRRNSGFTAIAVITLALGIGVNAAMFSMVNGLLLRPLPIRDPNQMTFLGFTRPGINNSDKMFSYPEFDEIRSQAGSVFSDAAALKFGGVESGQTTPDGLTVDGQTKPIETEFVTGNFFSMLGIRPTLGRFILPSEGAEAGEDPVIVLSYRYWATRFGRDPSILGKKALVNGHPVTIVGIAPKDFFGVTPLIDIQGYMPLGMATVEEGVPGGFLADPKYRSLVVLARENTPNPQPVLQVVGARLLKAHPRNEQEGALRAYPLRPPGMISGPNPFPQIVGLFLTLAGLVLLLACVNVSNFALVRGLVREREMVVRAALGAGRARLLRQLLTESLVLAFLGGCGGTLVGVLASSALASISLPTQLPMVLNFQLDWRVLAYAAATTIFATAWVGIVPACPRR